MKRFFLLVSLIVAGQTSSADIIETEVTLPDGLGKGIMYLNDDQKDPGPGVIVVHEWWGLND